MPVPRVFGVETEYGYTHLPSDGPGLPRPELLTLINVLAADILPCVRAADHRGWFLANSSRFYLDWTSCADKPEYATGECSDPVVLLRRIQDGDAFLETLACRVEQKLGGRMIFSKTNVDHISGNTWGCHESYHIRRGIEFHNGLIPFLCSRVILGGSGGFQSVPGGLKFTISPRVPFLERITGIESQHSRPLIHLRDESHARDCDERIHLIVGEGLFSETSNLLRVATTAIVVGLLEAGVHPGPEVALNNPLAAIRRFAEDPACRVKVKTAQGPPLRAIDIQRRYLLLAGDHIASLPVWTETVLKLWKDVLDHLESGEEQRGTPRLDWVIRHQLYSKFIQDRDTAWKSLAGPALSPELTLTRAELLELDTKFGMVGDRGMFASLDRRACLRHRVDAREFPPDVPTRADLRGAAIKSACDQGRASLVSAEWNFLFNQEDRTMFSLMDPYQQTAEWQTVNPETSPRQMRLERLFS